MDVLGKGGRKAEGLFGGGQLLEDEVHGGLKAHLHDHVGLVDHQHLQVVRAQPRALLHVLHQPTRRADQHVHLLNSLLLVFEVLTPDQQRNRKFLQLSDALIHLEHLKVTVAEWNV